MNALRNTRLSNPRLAIAVAALGWLAWGTLARAQGIDGLSPISYVSDFAIALTPEVRDQLSNVCVELDDRAHAQIAVVTIHSLDGASIDDVADRLYKHWNIGYPPENRGALVLIVTNEHKSKVAIGSGFDSILPPAKLDALNRDAMKLLAGGDNNRGTVYLTGEVARSIGAERHVALASQPEVQLTPPPMVSFSGSAGTVLLGVLAVVACGALVVLVVPLLKKPQSGAPAGGSASGSFGAGSGFGGFGGSASAGGGA